MKLRIAVVDCLATSPTGKRVSSVDVIGAGPRLVVGILKKLGVDVYLFECNTALKGPIGSRQDFDALMVSGMSADVATMGMVLKKWKHVEWSIAGGPACVDYEDLLRLGFNAVVWGEAEISLPSLVKALRAGDLRDVPNLIFSEEGGNIVSKIVEDYAREPLLWSFTPDVESVKNYKYYWACRVYVETVRGCSNFYRTTLPVLLQNKTIKCEHCDICRTSNLEERLSCPLGIPPGCGYCLVPRLHGPARSRPVNQIVKEIEDLVELGVVRVVLSAPDILDYGRDWLVRPKPLTDPRYPPANIDALEQLLSAISSIPEIEKGRAYLMAENVKPNLVTEEVAKVLGRYLRGSTINIGLETGDWEHHKQLGRPSTIEEVLRAVKLLRDSGLVPYVYAIYGLPGESWRTIRKTIKVLKKATKLGAERVILYRFRPLKASALGGYPPPRTDPKGRALKNFVNTLEISAKKKLLGKSLKVAVVDISGKDAYIGYTLPHGPVAIVKSREDLRGKVVEVLVQKVRRREVECVPKTVGV
ncbi:MAG: radical SAM protein [Sulfolobales archaeon]